EYRLHSTPLRSHLRNAIRGVFQLLRPWRCSVSSVLQSNLPSYQRECKEWKLQLRRSPDGIDHAESSKRSLRSLDLRRRKRNPVDTKVRSAGRARRLRAASPNGILPLLLPYPRLSYVLNETVSHLTKRVALRTQSPNKINVNT
ncbi:unnamed protein product, partial [Ixodes persulcatus]